MLQLSSGSQRADGVKFSLSGQTISAVEATAQPAAGDIKLMSQLLAQIGAAIAKEILRSPSAVQQQSLPVYSFQPAWRHSQQSAAPTSLDHILAGVQLVLVVPTLHGLADTLRCPQCNSKSMAREGYATKTHSAKGLGPVHSFHYLAQVLKCDRCKGAHAA